MTDKVIDLAERRRLKERAKYAYSAPMRIADLREFERATGTKPKIYLNGSLLGEVVSTSESTLDD